MAQLAEGASQSVVGISAGRRSGTGVVWSSDGLVLTANHVIGRSQEPAVVLDDGRELAASVVGRDQYLDIALLKVQAGGLKPLARGAAREVRVGQFVLALSNANGEDASATAGVVTSTNRSMRGWWGVMIEDAIVSDAKLNPGYSGGPLVDAWGRMIGMNVAYFSGRGLAIPTESLSLTIEKLAKYGKLKKGFLGVVIEPFELPDNLAKDPGIGQEKGLLVRAVEDGSPAKSAGVTIGDIILRLGDFRATGEYELHKALTEEVVGKPVSLWVLRSENLAELRITPRETDE